MAFFNRFPSTNYNDINLDWIIDQVKKLKEAVSKINESVDTGLAARMTVAEGEIDTLQNEVETPSTGLMDRMTAAETDITTLQLSLVNSSDVYWIDFVNLDAAEVQKAWDAYHAGKLLVCDVLGQLFVQEYILDMTVMKLCAMSDSGGYNYVRYLSIYDFSPFYTLSSHYLMMDKDVTTVVAAGDSDLITSGGVYDALQLKQDVLTFDATPTPGSTNPVDSDGIAAALDLKQDVLTFDNTPTNGSNNPVKSGGVYTALQGKQDVLTFDAVPTDDSTNPVESGGVYDAINDNIVIDSFVIADAANYSIASDSNESFAQDVSKDGYDAIGIVGYTITGTDSNKIVFNRMYVGYGVANLRIYNPSGSQIDITNIRIWVLYKKS